MRFLTRFSLSNPVAVVILVLLVAIGGILSYFGLNEEFMPDLSYPVISIITAYPGASPIQVANDVTHPLEQALKGVQDVQTVTSTSVANVSEIELQFNMKVDQNTVEQKVQQSVGQVQLPSSAAKPNVQTYSMSSQPILQFAAISGNLSNEKLKATVNDTIVPAIQGVPGVQSVTTAGTDPDHVVIQFDSNKLSNNNLTMQEVLQDLKNDNVSMPLGTATVKNKVQSVQLNAKFKSLQDIQNLQIPLRVNPSAVPLSDLATVSVQPVQSGSINRTNGHPSISISVSKTQDANIVTVAKAVNNEIDTLNKQLPNGVHIIPLSDSSQMVKASVSGMLREALLGALFAVLVILLFLRNWRTTLIAVVSIPISMLMAVILLHSIGVTLNIMTLGGLAIATGRVVDDSIVVIENIYRAWKSGMGYGKKLVLYGTAEVGQAIFSSTVTTMAVFLPLGLVSGMVGKLFLPFALTVVFSLASSLLVALTIIPMFAWLFIVRKPVKGMAYDWTEANGFANDGVLHPSLIDGSVNMETSLLGDKRPSRLTPRPWQQKYRTLLSWCLDHKAWVLAATTVVLLASLSVLPFVGKTVIPNALQNEAVVLITMPTGTPLDGTNAKAKQAEQILEMDRSEVGQVHTQVGSGSTGKTSGSQFSFGASGTNIATLDVKLSPNTDVNRFLSQLRSQMAKLQTSDTKIQISGKSAGAGTSLALVVTGPNYSNIQTAVSLVTNRLENLPGLANVKSNLSQTQPQIQVSPDNIKAAKYGLTAGQIASMISSYVSQINMGTVNINGQTYDLNVALNSSAPLTSLSAIRNLPVATPTGQKVILGDVADVSTVQTPSSVLHQDGQEYAEITADYTTPNTSKTLKDALQASNSLHLPSGVKIQQSSASQQQSKSISELIEAILVAIGMVYIVMLVTFGEWSAPFAILFSMPVALIGAFLAIFLAHQPISLPALIGILMLMGIVVTNAIVLVNRVEQQRKSGFSIREALLEAGTTRLRPILMTAIATICALIPLAAGAAEGALISQPLAVVVIGGLMTSTVLTLYIVPIMYELLHFRAHRKEQQLLYVSHEQ